MSEKPGSEGSKALDPSAEAAALGIQIEAMRASLVRLLQEVVTAEARVVTSNSAAQMAEVNGVLVERALALQESAQAGGLDVLTRLPNRLTLRDRFGQAVAQSRRNGDRLALLFIDLDDFKPLNDLHGHPFGDRVLQLVAQRLLTAVREVDTVSRHGGDEFLILLVGLNQPQDAQAVADKLAAAVAEPASIDGHALSLSVSVGIAVHPDDGEELDALVARADAAMYAAKYRRGRHGAGVPDSLRTQAQLREANERLIVAAHSAQELLEAAEKARKRQEVLMAAVAEELRNPTAPVSIASTMVGHLPGDEPLLPRVQAVVEKRLTHLSRLIGNLVETSSASVAPLELAHEWVDMAPIIDGAAAAYRPVLDQRGQRFELRRPAGPLGVSGDADRLGQIVTNLLDNASQHTHDGGRISLVVAVEGESLQMTVADDGYGIGPQTLPYIFEPFVQDIHALGAGGPVPGIGLTVVRALVRAHGGNLSAHSPGLRRGSQFLVTLPLVGKPDARQDD
jgi:diguanylate cyclase (GGDEF)-like protein